MAPSPPPDRALLPAVHTSKSRPFINIVGLVKSSLNPTSRTSPQPQITNRRTPPYLGGWRSTADGAVIWVWAGIGLVDSDRHGGPLTVAPPTAAAGLGAGSGSGRPRLRKRRGAFEWRAPAPSSSRAVRLGQAIEAGSRGRHWAWAGGRGHRCGARGRRLGGGEGHQSAAGLAAPGVYMLVDRALTVDGVSRRVSGRPN